MDTVHWILSFFLNEYVKFRCINNHFGTTCWYNQTKMVVYIFSYKTNILEIKEIHTPLQ